MQIFYLKKIICIFITLFFTVRDSEYRNFCGYMILKLLSFMLRVNPSTLQDGIIIRKHILFLVLGAITLVGKNVASL